METFEHTPLLTILRKEIKQIWIIWLFSTLLLAGMYVIDQFLPVDLLMLRQLQSIFGLMISVFTAMTLGVIAYGQELDEHTVGYLKTRPIPQAYVYRLKIVLGGTASLIIGGVGLTVTPVQHLVHALSLSEDALQMVSSQAYLALILITYLFAVNATLFSFSKASALIGANLGIAIGFLALRHLGVGLTVFGICPILLLIGDLKVRQLWDIGW